MDSTCLLCKMAIESDEEIQPIYLKIHDIGNIEMEQRAQRRILEILKLKPQIKANIKTPVVFDIDGLPTSDEFEAAMKELEGTEVSLKSWKYYSKIARICLLYPGISIGIEAPPKSAGRISKILKFLHEHNMTVDEDGTVHCSKECPVSVIMGKFKFPIIYTSAEEEREYYRKYELDDVLKLTRSCLAGFPYPCGVCRCCELRLADEDSFRELFNDEAYRNYKIKQYLRKLDKKNGTSLHNEFMWYVTSGYQLGEGDYQTQSDSEAETISKEKSESLISYFDRLISAYPNMEGVNAPKD